MFQTKTHNIQLIISFVNHLVTAYLCIMFKRISVLTLVLLYFVTASGFALNLHYCGNYLASVKIDAPAKKCSPVKMKCCHDKKVVVKVKDAHQVKTPSLLSKLFYVDLPKLPFEDYLSPSQDEATDAPIQRGPPDVARSTPKYIQNCSFRI
jgi:hypothetical protein